MCAATRAFQPSRQEIEVAVPNLRIVREVQGGGQKLVFVARGPEGEVALKLIRPGPPSALARAQREIETLSRLNDPHFPRIFRTGSTGIGNTEGVLYIVEELLQGESLRERLLRDRQLALEDALAIARELLGALVVLGGNGIIHRDVKPENIFLESSRVVLIDFGIIRDLALESLTHDLALFGPCTPGYGAPEQIRNEKRSISSRTDLFALGVVLYEMVSGMNPFADPDPRRALEKTLRVDQPPLTSLGFPEALSLFVQRCLQKAPHRRMPSCGVALEEIREIRV